MQTMEEDEVVNCVCRHPDGDGMMVQCEVCLTWQHGGCMGVHSEEQVGWGYSVPLYSILKVIIKWGRHIWKINLL